MAKSGSFSIIILTLILVGVPISTRADEIKSCIDILNEPPLIDVLTRNDGHDFHEINVRGGSGHRLVGTTCTIEALTDYFEAAGWSFVSARTSEPRGPSGGSYKFFTDTYFKFCREGRNLFTLYLRKCVAGAGFHLLEGKISFVHAGGRK